MNRILYGATALMMMFSGSALAQTDNADPLADAAQAPAPQAPTQGEEVRYAGLPYAEQDMTVTGTRRAAVSAEPEAVRFDTPSAMAYSVPGRDYQHPDDARTVSAYREPTRLGRE